jgi:hypothetical protein
LHFELRHTVTKVATESPLNKSRVSIYRSNDSVCSDSANYKGITDVTGQPFRVLYKTSTRPHLTHTGSQDQSMKALVISEYAHPSKIPLTRDAPVPVPAPDSDERAQHGAQLFRCESHTCFPPSVILTRLKYGLKKKDFAGPRKVPDATAAPVRTRC